MKVVVTIEARFEVDVNAHSAEAAERAVHANWESVYKYDAKWLDGTAPTLQGGRVIDIKAKP